jgi:hypothetical protein
MFLISSHPNFIWWLFKYKSIFLKKNVARGFEYFADVYFINN